MRLFFEGRGPPARPAKPSQQTQSTLGAAGIGNINVPHNVQKILAGQWRPLALEIRSIAYGLSVWLSIGWQSSIRKMNGKKN